MSTIALESALDMMGEPMRALESFCFYDDMLGTICESEEPAIEGVKDLAKKAGNGIAFAIDKLIELVKKMTASLSAATIGFGKLKTVYLSAEFKKDTMHEIVTNAQALKNVADSKGSTDALEARKKRYSEAVNKNKLKEATDIVEQPTAPLVKAFKDTIAQLKACYEELTKAKSDARNEEDADKAKETVALVRAKISIIRYQIDLYHGLINGAKHGAKRAAGKGKNSSAEGTKEGASKEEGEDDVEHVSGAVESFISDDSWMAELEAE